MYVKKKSVRIIGPHSFNIYIYKRKYICTCMMDNGEGLLLVGSLFPG